MEIFDLPIILASASPRRKQLLEQAGFRPQVCPTHIDESYPPDLPAEEVAAFLAEKKARALWDIKTAEAESSLQGVILAADSIVLLDGRIYEKPKDEQDAERILRKLSDNTHEVITGVCLLSSKRKEVFSQSTRVTFAPLSHEEICWYIRQAQPFDKAGSYGIQDWIGLCKVKSIEGSYSNVMGLPMAATYEALKQFI